MSSQAKPKASFPPTEEQAAILAVDFLADEPPFVVGEAVAGSGKTATIGMLATKLGDEAKARDDDFPILYLCYNSANAKEARSKLPENVTALNIHALARSQTPEKLREKVGELTPSIVLRALGMEDSHESYSHAKEVIAVLGRFFNTEDPVVGFGHLDVGRNCTDAHRRRVLDEASSLWGKMCDENDPLPLPHDGYLKRWFLSAPKPGRYRLVIVDEAQDSNCLTVSVVVRWHKQYGIPVYVTGDRHQSIYSFRGAVNAIPDFAKLAGGNQYSLSRSWRYTKPIGRLAEVVLFRCKGERVRVDGAAKPLSRHEDFAVLGRTNAELFMAAVNRLKYKPEAKFHFVGTSRDDNWSPRGPYRFDLIEDFANAKLEKFELVRHPLLKKFTKWKDCSPAVYAAKDVEFGYCLRLVNILGAEEVLGWIQKIEAAAGPAGRRIKDADGVERYVGCRLYFASAHRSKGFEWDAVRLLSDFPHPGKAETWSKFDIAEAGQEANLLYIALTRARCRLDVRDASFIGWVCKDEPELKAYFERMAALAPKRPLVEAESKCDESSCDDS